MKDMLIYYSMLYREATMTNESICQVFHKIKLLKNFQYFLIPD